MVTPTGRVLGTGYDFRLVADYTPRKGDEAECDAKVETTGGGVDKVQH